MSDSEQEDRSDVGESHRGLTTPAPVVPSIASLKGNDKSVIEKESQEIESISNKISNVTSSVKKKLTSNESNLGKVIKNERISPTPIPDTHEIITGDDIILENNESPPESEKNRHWEPENVLNSSTSKEERLNNVDPNKRRSVGAYYKKGEYPYGGSSGLHIFFNKKSNSERITRNCNSVSGINITVSKHSRSGPILISKEDVINVDTQKLNKTFCTRNLTTLLRGKLTSVQEKIKNTFGM